MTQNPPPGWDGPPTSEFRAVQQPGHGTGGYGAGGYGSSGYGDYGAPPRKQGMSPVAIVALTVGAMLLIGLVIATVFLVVPRFTQDSAAPVTSTVSVTATAPESPAQPTVQPARPAQPAQPARPASPSGAYECSNAEDGAYSRSAVGSNATSCEFALSVWAEYLLAGGNGAPMVLDAYSPVTGEVYTMSCSGGDVVTCTGGNNAVVYIY